MHRIIIRSEIEGLIEIVRGVEITSFGTGSSTIGCMVKTKCGDDI